ncbi:MAG: hypothetical protein JW952_03105 [Candidatus Eisenbacteria bacterium]|nr:hypothetical protein [Candidatus Eisenbacteria bacterium]
MHVLVLCGAAWAARPGAGDPVSDALAEVGLTRQTARVDRNDMGFFGGDRCRLPLFDAFMNDPFRIPDLVPPLAVSALSSSQSLGPATVFAGLRVKAGVRRGLTGSVVAEYERRLKEPDCLTHAIEYLYEAASRGEVIELDPGLSKLTAALPDSLSEPLALVVLAAAEAVKWQGLAFESVEDRETLFEDAVRYVAALDSDKTDPALARRVEKAAGLVDYEYLNAGATDVATVLDSAAVRLARLVSAGGQWMKKLSFTCRTPLGEIIVNGTESNVYRGSLAPFLVVDLGGNDLYLSGGSTRSASNCISILIDVGGDDRYVCPASASRDTSGKGGTSVKTTPSPTAEVGMDMPSFGAAALGYGFLVDLGGNDYYDGRNLSQGAAIFGVGILCDESGDDRMKSFTASQGAGLFGLGIAINKNGDDQYYIYQQGQGYGYVKGCGLLIDGEGDDTYVANDTDIVFPSAQSKEHNTSLAQGVGFGKRADYVDGHSLAGGVGMLVDARGNDKYWCGVFGQGCSYWYGVGILADSSGNDEYNGVWYVQGSTAHFGVGVLHDALGDDHYRASINMAQGAGHDFGVGFLLDESGDDVYDAPNLSLGGGNANGIGVFWDKKGDDTYNVSAAMTLGRADVGAPRGGLRDKMLCLGLFLDTGGRDKYSKPFARNGKAWTQAGPNELEPIPTEKGVGLDR